MNLPPHQPPKSQLLECCTRRAERTKRLKAQPYKASAESTLRSGVRVEKRHFMNTLIYYRSFTWGSNSYFRFGTSFGKCLEPPKQEQVPPHANDVHQRVANLNSCPFGFASCERKGWVGPVSGQPTDCRWVCCLSWYPWGCLKGVRKPNGNRADLCPNRRQIHLALHHVSSGI